MASTNKTTNYNLSQFIGTDKPAWLSDYNQDMSRIDTGIKSAADTATSADGKADAANTAIGELTDLSTTNKNNLVAAVNEVDSNADTAQNTATNAATTANSNTIKINALDAYLNLNNFTNPSISAVGGTITSSNLGCASNSTGSLGKIYGQINLTSTTSTTTVSFPTPLRPSSTLTINGLVFAQWSDNGSSWSSVGARSIVIDTSGNASITLTGVVNNRLTRLYLSACVIFAKPFGDVPIPEE